MTTPIPQQASGILYGSPSANVNLDVFLDIQCPHSKKLWPTLMQVMDQYADKSVNLKTHIITISNHRQAWDMSLGLFAATDGDAEKFYRFATFLYERQEQYYNGVFLHKSSFDLQQLAADLATEFDPKLNRESFLKKMSSDEVYTFARTPIRYAATRSAWATPTIFVNNGGNVPVNPSSSLEDWQKMLDPLLQ